MVDTVTLQQEEIYAEFKLLVFSVILIYNCTRTSDGPNWPSTLVVFSLINKWIFSRKLGQFVPSLFELQWPEVTYFTFSPAFSPIQNLAVTLDYTSPWWWRWTSYCFPPQVPKSLDWRYVIILCCFMSTQVALFRWQLWLVWCCVKFWNRYWGRILSQFLQQREKTSV